MNFRNKLVAVVGSTLLLASSITMGSAETDASKDAVVEITTDSRVNFRSVSIVESEFAPRVYSNDLQTTTGSLTIQAVNTLGTGQGFSVTLDATDFVGADNTVTTNIDESLESIPVSNLSLGAGAVTKTSTAGTTAGMVTLPYAPVDAATTAKNVWTAPRGGIGTYDMVMSGTLTIPGGTLVGDYTSNVTVSIDAAP